MHILVLSPRQLWPTNSGAKLREFHLAKALGRAGKLTLLHFLEPGEPAPSPSDLPFCDRVIAIPRPPLYTPIKLLQGVVGRWPLPVVNYYCPRMAAALRQLLSEQTFDIVHFESMNMVGYLPILESLSPASSRMLDWHNIDSELMERHAESNPFGPRKLYAQLTARRTYSLETRMLASLDGHIVCSERERVTLRKRSPNARIAVINNGVDVTSFQTARAAAANESLIFVGQMSYQPNIEGALYFVRSVWPAVRKRFPSLRLRIVGANPAPAVRALASEPNVEVTGTVPDVRPYYADALAAIVPLLTGAGTRLKILEAMAANVPVISTPIGAEGLEVEDGKQILLASTPDEWLASLAELYGHAERTAELTRSARSLVEQRYDWQVIGAMLSEHYRDWVAHPTPPVLA